MQHSRSLPKHAIPAKVNIKDADRYRLPASMEFNFDDELSEEWISQPRSSDVSDLQEDTSVLRRSTNGSRIPLPKSQSTSSLLRRTQGHVLSEKTASALNVEKSGALAKEHGKGYPQGTASASSAEELGSVLLGTVQLKGQEGAKQGTPEWKRRLLNSGGAARNQQGLFSPIGLENVFRPPTVRKEMSARFKRARTSAPTTSIPPSSPPVLPGRILPPMATQSPDESLQLPPLAPVLPSLQTSLRHSSGARSHALSGKSYLRHESFSPVQLDSDNRRTRRSHSGSLSICRDSSVHDISRPASSMSDGVLEIRGLGPSAEDSQVDPNRTSSSLPENLQPESEAYAFVTMRRGGYSSEGSFQQKPLSPSSFQPQSTPARPALDGRLPEVCSTPQTPRTKHKPQGDNDPLEQSPRLSRSPQKLSPLKLFDKYDTFTNDRLNRRISQFEIGGDRTENESDIFEDGMGSTPSPRREQQAQEQDSYPARKQNKRMSSFGDGMLDKFDFTHEQEAQRALQWPEEENRMQSASDPTSNKAKSPESSMVESQETHKQFNMVVKKQQTMGTSWEEEISEPLPEGKRQRSSPQKVPNAKRRRTIQQSPENGPGIEMQRQRPQLSQNNSIAGRKRKDALYNNSSPTADPEVIATRPMLRPKVRQQNSPGGSRQISVAKTADTDDSDETEKPVIDLETATGLLAGELANLALNVAEGITQGVRKKSVTTADFFREANLIMQNIRSNAIQRDGVRNVLGSDMGRLQGIEESGADVFSTDTFSRPPSREGSPPRRKVPGPKDFRVISRLRKFEDTDDLGLALNSSFKRLRRREHNDDDVVSETAQGELSNVRILEPIRNRQFGEAGGVGDSAGRDKDAIAETYPSSKSSTNRSIHTGSSGTRTKAIIAPEKVSHLIMDKMGRMTFDYEKRCWVKRKPSEDHSAAGEHLASEATEDDPFKEIPDLDIDESHELRNVRGTAISQPTSTRKLNKDQLPPMPNQPLKETPFCDPHPEDAQSSVVIGQSGSPPSVSAMDRHIASTRPLDGSNRAQEAAVEIALSKGQVAQILVQAGNKPTQARAVTVAFSSPLIQPHPVSPVNEWDDASRLDLDANSFLEGDAGRRQNVNEGEERSSRTPRSRLSSSIKRTQSAQILPKIDEGEKTPSPSSGGNRTDDLAIALATPQVVAKKAKGMLLAPSAAKSYVAMQLTPLSDFTIHHADESLNLDVQYLAKRRGLASIQEIEGKFSLSIKDLVEKIADVEPYEPYWEQLRSLSLPGRGLFTLHMLDDFCNSIEELDVSNNELGQLNGAPQSLRVLDARHNCLSSLTAWGHLYNLQYIDISNNEIDSLVGFRELLHIRELKAENNQIDSLDGVLHLNGLLKLQLGNNCIKALNLHDSDL